MTLWTGTDLCGQNVVFVLFYLEDESSKLRFVLQTGKQLSADMERRGVHLYLQRCDRQSVFFDLTSGYILVLL
jgi:deoxyribodipyrimidine photolyase